jgi:enamine deaminase RidA (YjgF/YER057c/UK114 family)
MTIERIGTGKRMSQAVIRDSTIYIAGQVANKAAGQTVTEQTREILETIDLLLAQAGTAKSSLLMVTIWLSDMASFAEMNAVWDAWVDTAAPPARATVEARLAAPQFSVEIAAIAAR